MIRRLIVTADDFGMSTEVNEAVEIAHRKGILTSASLVVAGDAADDAIRRAKRMPNLGVGLHLALYGAPAQFNPRAGSRLAPDGINLGERPVTTGAAIVLSAHTRADARREIAAQFDAWRRSGLRLGHLDGHWHCHQHPSVLSMALSLGKHLGLRAIRVPYESFGLSRCVGVGMTFKRLVEAACHRPLAIAMRYQIQNAGLRSNDWFFGKNDEGMITTQLLDRLIKNLPAGTTEIGLHPATEQWHGRHAPPGAWNPKTELDALTDPALREAIYSRGVQLARWDDIP